MNLLTLTTRPREALPNLLGAVALWAWLACKAGFAAHRPERLAKKPTPQTAASKPAAHSGFADLAGAPRASAIAVAQGGWAHNLLQRRF
jgi:hypothetical protein